MQSQNQPPTPYNEGFSTGAAGLGSERNPHEKDTKDFDDWLDGWVDGRTDMDNKQKNRKEKKSDYYSSH
jgi:ribosome modulation factor